MQIVRNNDLRVANGSHKNENHATCKSFNSSNSANTIHHTLINSNSSVLVEQCEFSMHNVVHTDHNSLEMSLKLLFNKKAQNPRNEVIFYKFMNSETKMSFNKNLKKVENCVDLGYDECCKHMRDSAKDVACEKHEDKKRMDLP